MWWQWRDSNPQSPPWKGGVLLFSTTLPFMSERLPAQFSWIYHNLYHYNHIWVRFNKVYLLHWYQSFQKRFVDIVWEDTFLRFSRTGAERWIWTNTLQLLPLQLRVWSRWQSLKRLTPRTSTIPSLLHFGVTAGVKPALCQVVKDNSSGQRSLWTLNITIFNLSKFNHRNEPYLFGT